MNFAEIKIVKSVISKEIGLLWIPFLIKCFIKKKSVFKNTHWINEESSESKFTKRLSFASTLYLELQKKFGKKKAFDVMRKILVPIGCNEQWQHLHTLKNNENTMDNLMAFNDLMDKKGTPRFNRREYLEQNDIICHFVITRCLFNDFFKETKTSELTRLFCEIDKEFFPEAFPGFDFHRGNSWENTIAYGKNRCEFIFERKTQNKTTYLPLRI